MGPYTEVRTHTGPYTEVRWSRAAGLHWSRRRAAGHSGSARAMRASVPSCPALRDSPFASGSKASFDWMFRRSAHMSGPACGGSVRRSGAFVGAPTPMPSAEFRAAMTALAGTLGPGLSHATRTSGGKTGRLHRTAAGLPTLALDGRGFGDCPPVALPRATSLHAPSIPRHRLAPRIRGPFRCARRGETPLSGVCVTLIRARRTDRRRSASSALRSRDGEPSRKRFMQLRAFGPLRAGSPRSQEHPAS